MKNSSGVAILYLCDHKRLQTYNERISLCGAGDIQRSNVRTFCLHVTIILYADFPQLGFP